jgi:hypothetical protein
MTRCTVGLLILLAFGIVCAPLGVAAPPGERGSRPHRQRYRWRSSTFVSDEQLNRQ